MLRPAATDVCTRVAFGDVVRQVRDRVDPDESGLERYVAGEHMDTDDLRIRRWGSIGDGYLGPAFHMRFRRGHVLYGSRRTYLRKVAVADFEGITANTTFVLESKNPQVLLPDLLPFIMQTESFHEHSIKQSKGSVNPYINFSDLTWYEFPLPSLEQQRRIVALVSTLLRALESLRVASSHCSAVRRAMLVRLFPVVDSSPSSVTLTDLVEKGELEFKTGPFGTVLSASEYESDGWPVVNPTEMTDGQIEYRGGPCVSDATASRLGVYRLSPGDILLARKGDFSKAVLAADDHKGWVAGSDTIRLRCRSERVVSAYLYLCLRAPSAARLLHSYAHGTVMPGLNEKMLGKLTIRLPMPAEQERIVALFEHGSDAARELRERERTHRSLFSAALVRAFSPQGDAA